MSGLNGFEFGVLVIVALACLGVVAVNAWLSSVVNKRVQAENRDLLKAVLALSTAPHAAPMAAAMENTDHADVRGEHETEQALHANGSRVVRMRAAGSG